MINTTLDLENSPETLLELSRAYLKENDPAEYFFAKRHFHTWEAWKKFSQENGPIIDLWRDELAAKLRSEALGRIIEAAKGETRDALSANKYIFETLEEDTSGKQNKVGRPSKEAIQKEAQRLLDDDKLRDEAYNRLFKVDA